MEHYKSGQYDDDLTVGIDDYDDDFDAGDVDLFDYVGDEDSPLSRLKTIILSIDWEITDDILRQFNEELQELKDIWANEKINLIYVQALEKISRYIYKEKSSAHPNAIKLLLAFYTNLEKIVSDDTLPDKETKQILLGDIERFEKLKKQISPSAQASAEVQAAPETPEPPEVEPVEEEIVETPDIQEEALSPASADADDPLLNLKAIVYGIDWEITERDLKNLSSEVKILEEKFKSSKAKQIFLQGIGSLGAYINLKRSDAHADAFKLLHSFFVGLETVVRDNLTGQAEKDILLPQVERFNSFKAAIAETISPDAVEKSVAEPEDQGDDYGESEIQPAFADVPDDVQGFQEEQEAANLDSPASDVEAEESIDEYFEDEIEEHVSEGDKALAQEMESRLAGMFEEPDKDAALGLDADVALQGVDVETEADDESDEEPLPVEDGEFAPALAAEEPMPEDEESPAVFADKVDETLGEPEPETAEEIVVGGEIPGVDVEHDADDDTDEPPLPTEDGEIAPAFSDDFADSEAADVGIEATEIDDKIDDFFGEPSEEEKPETEAIAFTDDVEEEVAAPITTDIDDKVSDFFGDDEIQAPPESDETALAGVDVETEADDDSDEEPLALTDGEFAPALASDEEDEDIEPIAAAADENLITEEVEERDEVAAEAELSEETESAEIDDRFDTLFAEETDEPDTTLQDVPQVAEEELEAADILVDEPILESEKVDTTDIQTDEVLAEEEVVIDEDQILQGVDVEHEADDDSDEEPLPFEDGELAPALAADGEEPTAEEQKDEEQEALVGDRFDAVFGADEEAVDLENDSEIIDDIAEPDELSDEEALFDEEELADEEVLFDEEELADEEILFDEEELAETTLEDEAEVEADVALDEATVDAPDLLAYEEAGFEEIVEEEIEEIPEEAFIATEDDAVLASEDKVEATEAIEEETEEDEILALLGDETDSESLFAEETLAEDAVTDLSEDDDTLADDAVTELSEDDDILADDAVAELSEDDDILADDEIEEVSVDELATLLSETDGVTTAGDIPSGYPSTDELLSEFGEVAGDDAEQIITHPEDNTDYIVAVEGLDELQEDEEVVFEPVVEDEESEKAAEEDPIAEPTFDESATFGTTLLTDDDDFLKKEEFTTEITEEEPQEILADESTVESEEVELTAETANDAAYVAADAVVPTEDNLGDLRNCIVSLGLEIDDAIVNSLNEEIEKLRHAWLDKPAEKTFVQLLSTVSAHIERYRYEADPEANKLLLSIFDKLELCVLGQSDDSQIQEAILNETSKVLQWQARLIDRAPVTDTESETAESQDTQDTGMQVAVPEQEEPTISETSDFTETVVDDMEKKQLMENVSAIMKSELDQLIQAFQTEIKGLKDEIRQVKEKKD